ncbi:MAG: hypothetical protein ACKO96_38620, partial [Flammeovirgaceae bacterium]
QNPKTPKPHKINIKIFLHKCNSSIGPASYISQLMQRAHSRINVVCARRQHYSSAPTANRSSTAARTT